MRSRSWRRWKGSGCCSALSLRSATCATYSDQWHRGGSVERNSHRSGVYRPATEQRGPLCTVERRCHAPRSAYCDECPGRGDHKGGARNLSSVYQAFTLSGQCTGKRDMFFLRARHFHLLHFPRFGGFLFAKRTGKAEFGLPCWTCPLIVADGSPHSLGGHFPASTLPSVRCVFAPPSFGGVFYARRRTAGNLTKLLWDNP